MGSFINTKVTDKEYIPLIIDFSDVNLEIGFEYFQVIDSGKKFSLIGYPNVFEMGNKDLDAFQGKCVLIDNLWKEPVKDAKFTFLQNLFINGLKQLKPEIIYAGTLELTTSSKRLKAIFESSNPLEEFFTIWKIADDFESAAKIIDDFKLPKMSPTMSKSFTPKESEYDRLVARKKFIIEEYTRIHGEESLSEFDTELAKNFWDLIKVIVG